MARSYDPLAGQFTSADTTLAGGLNRYAYVRGNPETRTDPSGHNPISPARDYNSRLAYQQWLAQPVHVYFGDVGTFLADTGQFFLGTDTLKQSYHTIFQDPHASAGDRLRAAGVGLMTLGIDALTIGAPEFGEEARAGEETWLAADAITAADATTAAATEVDAVATDTAVDNAEAVAHNSEGGAQEGGTAPNLVYRGGSATPTNLTPRPGIDTTGLSTFDTPEAAAPTGGKAQVIDISQLTRVRAFPDAPPAGHVSLAPADSSLIAGWAATRGTDEMSPFTQDILNAVIGEIRVPKP